MRIVFRIAIAKRPLAALHCNVVVGADHLRVVEQLAAVDIVALATLRQQALAVVPVDRRCMVLIVKHRPKLEAGIGDRHADAIPLCEFQCLLEPLVFVSVEHCPNASLHAATEGLLERTTVLLAIKG